MIEFEFGMFTYERGANQVTRRKTSRRREQAQPAYGMSMRAISRLHWWEASSIQHYPCPHLSTYNRRTTFLFLLAALALSYPFPLLLFTDKYVNEN